jgi:hypothetical protein
MFINAPAYAPSNAHKLKIFSKIGRYPPCRISRVCEFDQERRSIPTSCEDLHPPTPCGCHRGPSCSCDNPGIATDSYSQHPDRLDREAACDRRSSPGPGTPDVCRMDPHTMDETAAKHAASFSTPIHSHAWMQTRALSHAFDLWGADAVHIGSPNRPGSGIDTQRMDVALCSARLYFLVA